MFPQLPIQERQLRINNEPVSYCTHSNKTTNLSLHNAYKKLFHPSLEDLSNSILPTDDRSVSDRGSKSKVTIQCTTVYYTVYTQTLFVMLSVSTSNTYNAHN